MATPTSRPKLIEPHDGGWLDHVRTSIFALQLASELTRDEHKIAEVREVIRQLQTLLAVHAIRRERAIFTEPELPHVDEVETKARALAGETGMAGIVTRSTQEQVRDRIASYALEDEGYREQLLALAASRGGIYAEAVEEMRRRAVLRDLDARRT
jgi:hypothetical protein